MQVKSDQKARTASSRKAGRPAPAPISIGKNVWFGSNAIIEFGKSLK